MCIFIFPVGGCLCPGLASRNAGALLLVVNSTQLSLSLRGLFLLLLSFILCSSILSEVAQSHLELQAPHSLLCLLSSCLVPPKPEPSHSCCSAAPGAGASFPSSLPLRAASPAQTPSGKGTHSGICGVQRGSSREGTI